MRRKERHASTLQRVERNDALRACTDDHCSRAGVPPCARQSGKSNPRCRGANRQDEGSRARVPASDAGREGKRKLIARLPSVAAVLAAGTDDGLQPDGTPGGAGVSYPRSGSGEGRCEGRKCTRYPDFARSYGRKNPITACCQRPDWNLATQWPGGPLAKAPSVRVSGERLRRVPCANTRGEESCAASLCGPRAPAA